MLKSVNVMKVVPKCVRLVKYQQQFRIICVRNIFRKREARRKLRLYDVLLPCGGLLIKPIIECVHCKDHVVSDDC